MVHVFCENTTCYIHYNVKTNVTFSPNLISIKSGTMPLEDNATVQQSTFPCNEDTFLHGTGRKYCFNDEEKDQLSLLSSTKPTLIRI